MKKFSCEARITHWPRCVRHATRRKISVKFFSLNKSIGTASAAKSVRRCKSNFQFTFMKIKFFKFVVCALACLSFIASVAIAAVVPPSPTVTLSWDYPSDQLGTNLTFKIYHSTDITVPMTSWTVLTNVVGTNLSAKIPMGSGAHFFALTASNSAGESAFATVSP